MSSLRASQTKTDGEWVNASTSLIFYVKCTVNTFDFLMALHEDLRVS